MNCFKIYFSVFIIYITSLLLFTLYINICYNLQISIILICKLGNALNANEVCPWIPMKKCMLIMLILMLLDLNSGYPDVSWYTVVLKHIIPIFLRSGTHSTEIKKPINLTWVFVKYFTEAWNSVFWYCLC